MIYRVNGVIRVKLNRLVSENVRIMTVLKPNSITLDSSELAPNMFGASSELIWSWFEAEIWPITTVREKVANSTGFPQIKGHIGVSCRGNIMRVVL